MFLFLPLIVWIFLWLILSRSTTCWRSSVLATSLVWGVSLTLITETLSSFRWLTFTGLIASWGIITIALAYSYVRVRKPNPSLNFQQFIDTHLKQNASPFIIGCLSSIGFIVFMVGLIAIVAPPNNSDSMTYHLPRVMHWIQNRSVNHYPTSILRQLYQSPWTEFAILHAQILSGGDRFANLVQWFSMIGSIIGVSLIAKQLGADLRGQVLAALLCATLPMGILQGSNTKNDYVLSFWLVCLVHYLISMDKGKIKPSNLLGFSLSLGLAFLTKGMAYIYVIPFLIWAFIVCVRQRRSAAWKLALAGIGIAIGINLGHYLRNIDLFGSPLSTGGEKYTNDSLNLPVFISNLTRNISLHLIIPFNVSANSVLSYVVDLIHQAIGIDPSDPRITWVNTKFSIPALANQQNDEDFAGNPLHFVLGIITTIGFLTRKYWRTDRFLVSYLAANIGAFLLFCLVLKWQPWHSRLHLPLFVLFTAFSGTTLSKLINTKVSTYLAIILVQLALLWVFFNQSRPLIASRNIFNSDRIDLYFHNQANVVSVSTKIVNSITSRNCLNVGLVIGENTGEYLLWVLFQASQHRTRLEHVNVPNVSSLKSQIAPFRDFDPCFTLTIK